MIQFGRMDAKQRWSAIEYGAIDTALKNFIDCLRTASRHATRDEYFLPAGTLVENADLEDIRIEFTLIELDAQSQNIVWATDTPYQSSGEWLRCLVRRGRGDTLAGCLLRQDRVYRPAEFERVLIASLDTGRERAGSYAVLDSQRLPRPTKRTGFSVLRHGRLVECRCENPNCFRSGEPLLLSVPASAIASYARGGLWQPAYPCPFCPGDQDARWALTTGPVPETQGIFDSKGKTLLEYPMDPLFKRTTTVAGRIDDVTHSRNPLAWGHSWNAPDVTPLPPELLHCLRNPYLPAVLDAAIDGHEVGWLAPYILSPDNSRALVELCRELPEDNKTAGLAYALATVLDPRRQSNFVTEDDRSQEARSRYPYIACGPSRFLNILRFFGLLQHGGRFIDVGCGTGEKPFLAYGLCRFERCDGIEVNQQSLAVAGFLLSAIESESRLPINCMAADALNFDDYGDYDVIYMYRPIHDRLLMGQLIRRIAEQMRPGAIAMDIHDSLLALRRGEDGLYQLRSDSGERAEWIGPVELEVFLEERKLG